MASPPGKSRREILKGAASTALAVSFTNLAACFPDVGGTWPASQPLDEQEPRCDDDGPAAVESATVVDVHREDSVVETTHTNSVATLDTQYEVVAAMVDEALSILAGEAANPWPTLLPTYRPGMRIGLKVNCLNMRLPTSPAVIRAIIANLKTHLLIDPANIVVWDRRLDELVDTGKYTDEDLQGATLLGTVRSFDDPSGPGYSSTFCGAVEGATPRLSRILTQLTDLTINCPVLKTHIVSGVTAGLKNIYGIIDNPGMYHTNLLTALPALYRLPPIRKHLQLTIVDALRCVTLGGTDSAPDTTARRIFVGRDPLAVDRYALDLVNSLRHTRKKDPVDPSLTGWINRAFELGLGAQSYDLIQR
jgi:uncharacterized protein (DUF362 family)